MTDNSTVFKTAINGTLVQKNKDVLPNGTGTIETTAYLTGSVITISYLTHLYASSITLIDRNTIMKDGALVPSETYVDISLLGN